MQFSAMPPPSQESVYSARSCPKRNNNLGLELEIKVNNDLHIVKLSGQFCDITLFRLSEASEIVLQSTLLATVPSVGLL